MDRRARRRAVQALEHEDFELLVHELLVADRGGEGITLRKLTPPDGGADSLVLGRGDAVDGVFQAKHSPDRTPDWARWERSLDDAVAYWRPPLMTFVVSRDFTRDQQHEFSRRLGQRHPGVDVDALTLTDLERLLDEHQHVAARFIGPDARDVHRSVARAMTMGGAELETAADLGARAGELADFADELDPRFEYEQALGRREPHWDEDPYMSVVEETSERRYVHTAAFVRAEAEVPPVLIAFTDDEAGRAAREHAREELARGRVAVLDRGVRLIFPDAPRLVREMAEEDVTMYRGVLSPGPSVEVDVALETAGGTLERTFTMRSVPPKTGAGLALAAVDGALWFELVFPEPPSADFHLSCSARFGPRARENLVAASWARALTGDAEVSLTSPDLLPEGLEAPLGGRDPKARAELTRRSELYADVLFIERSLGVELSLPERLSREDLGIIKTACDILRTGRGEGTFHGGKMLVPSDEVRRYTGAIQGARRRDRIELELWGTRLDLGVGEWALPPLEVVERHQVPAADGGDVELVLKPLAEGRMTFELVNRDGLGLAVEPKPA
jgi:hypothetical protein